MKIHIIGLFKTGIYYVQQQQSRVMCNIHLFPPRAFCSSFVSTESLYGTITFFLPIDWSARACKWRNVLVPCVYSRPTQYTCNATRMPMTACYFNNITLIIGIIFSHDLNLLRGKDQNYLYHMHNLISIDLNKSAENIANSYFQIWCFLLENLPK